MVNIPYMDGMDGMGTDESLRLYDDWKVLHTSTNDVSVFSRWKASP